MDTETKVYKQKNLTFFISDDKVVVQTSLPQTFYLEPTGHYYTRRLRTIALMIELNEIRNLNELAEWCLGGRAIKWVNTSEKFENLEPLVV